MSSFTADTKVVRIGRFHAPPVAYAAQRRAILWPVWEFHVALSRGVGDRDDLNILQRPVLEMCCTGERTTAAIAAALQLDPDLVAHILTELHDQGIIDGSARPTTERKQQEVVGHDDLYSVLQDAIGGETLPRVLQRLGTVESRTTSDGRGERPEIRTTPRRPWTRPAWFYPPVNVHPASPTVPELLQAAAQHRRAHSQATRRFPDLQRPGAPPKIGRVAAVVDRPQPAFLLLSLYFDPGANDGEGDWAVWDPSLAAPSSTLRSLVSKHQPRLTLLRTITEELVREAIGTQGPEYELVMAQARAEAERSMEMRIPDSRHVTNVRAREFLLEVFTHLAESRLDPQRANRHLERAGFASGQFTERVLSDALANTPELASGMTAQLGLGARHMRTLMEEWAQSAGFVTPLPARLTGLFGMAKKMNRGQLSQREKTYALIVRSISSTMSPLARMATRAPDLFETLEFIGETRNDNAHEHPESPHVEQLIEALAQIVDLHISMQLEAGV